MKQFVTHIRTTILFWTILILGVQLILTGVLYILGYTDWWGTPSAVARFFVVIFGIGIGIELLVGYMVWRFFRRIFKRDEIIDVTPKDVF